MLLVGAVEERADVTMLTESAAGNLQRMVVGFHISPHKERVRAYAPVIVWRPRETIWTILDTQLSSHATLHLARSGRLGLPIVPLGFTPES
jgi:hypothetical protein